MFVKYLLNVHTIVVMKKHYSYVSVCQILVEPAYYSCYEEALLIRKCFINYSLNVHTIVVKKKHYSYVSVCQILVERAFYSC